MIGRNWLGKVAIRNDCDLHWDETIMTFRRGLSNWRARWTFISELN